MALAEMIKARIAVHVSAADELAANLQALGCCEFIADGDSEDEASISDLRARQRHNEELLGDSRFVVRMLEPMEQNKESALARMLGDIPEISFEDLSARVDEAKFQTFVRELREKERSLTECHTELSRYRGLIAQAELLQSINYPLEFFTKGTHEITGIVVSIAKPASSQFSRLLSEALGEYFELQELSGDSKEASSAFAVLFRKEDQDKVLGMCNELSAVRIDVPKDFELMAEDEKERFSVAASRLEEAEAEICGHLAACADEGLEMARYFGDYWLIIKDRLESMISALPTRDVLIWSFWLPKESFSAVESEVKKHEILCDLAIVEPGEEDTPPTLLKNPKWSSCMEPLTLMYGTPTYGRTDPTSLMAPFFFLFLGMCFGDAGYGLVLSGVLGYLLIKHNLPSTMRKFFIMMFVGMLCTIVYGIISASFFGNSIDAFPFLSFLVPIKDKLMLLDPMNDPMTLLIISMVLGFIHIMFGLCIAFYENWTHGDRFAALADQGGWIVFICGLVLYGLSAGGVITSSFGHQTKYVAYAGAMILVATQGRGKSGLFGKLFSGILSLYNVTGYLGDVLSYSRLLALGLGSAAIGLVLNLLATLLVEVPYVGIPLAILVFVLGHIFSIMVNLLGAFIHSLRLQYVEFFGKFYNAEGRDFLPLQNRTQFARLTDGPSTH